MIFKETAVKDALIIELEKFTDDRGFFARGWCAKEFEANGIAKPFVQANVAYTKKRGTIRGLHYQVSPYEESKLIRCVKGALYDIIIDLRKESPTYKQWMGVELNEDNYRMLYVPEGFAHSYQTLEDNTEVFYPVSAFYHPAAERGIRWNDPAFSVTWPITENVILSEKDQTWPLWKDADILAPQSISSETGKLP